MSSETKEFILSMKRSLERKPVKLMLRLVLSKDSKGKTVLEYTLEDIAGVPGKKPLLAKFLKPIVKRFVKAVTERAGGKAEELLEALKKPYYRKAAVAFALGALKYGINTPFTPGIPMMIVWNVTYACNLACQHCYLNAGHIKPELSSKEKIMMMERIASAGVPIIAFSGGEPLADPVIWDLIKIASDYGMYVAMATNATLITEEVADRLAKLGLNYAQVSIDSTRPEVHDAFRGRTGTWERAVKGIKRLKERGVMVELSTTLTRFTYRDIDAIIKLGEELGVDIVMHFNFVPTGRGSHYIHLDLTPDMRMEVLSKLIKRLAEGGKPPAMSTAPQLAALGLALGKEYGKYVVAGHFYGVTLPEHFKDVAYFLGGCGAGRFYMAVEPDGTVTPCVFLPVKVGNLREQRLEEIWDSSEVFKELRDRGKYLDPCKSCEYRDACGGCRARAFAYFGNYLAPDPGCPLYKEPWKLVLEGKNPYGEKKVELVKRWVDIEDLERFAPKNSEVGDYVLAAVSALGGAAKENEIASLLYLSKVRYGKPEIDFRWYVNCVNAWEIHYTLYKMSRTKVLKFENGVYRLGEGVQPRKHIESKLSEIVNEVGRDKVVDEACTNFIRLMYGESELEELKRYLLTMEHSIGTKQADVYNLR